MPIPKYVPRGSSSNEDGVPLSLDTYTGLLPAPYVLGGPRKYSRWRAGQEAAIMTSMDSEMPFVIECLPTGAGKSLIYTMEAVMTVAAGGRALILTSTKGLQDQVMRDMAECGIVDVRGQMNYRCDAMALGGEYEWLNPTGAWIPVVDGPCMDGEECSLKLGGCGYFDAIRRAARARIVVTNYAMWLTQARMPPEMSIGKFDLIICDEAHNTVNEVCDYMAIELTKKDEKWIDTALGISLPTSSDATCLATWTEWSKYTVGQLDLLTEYTRDVKVKRQARKLRPKLVQMSQMSDSNWVMELGPRGSGDESDQNRSSSPTPPLSSQVSDRADRSRARETVVCKFDPVWPLAAAKLLLFRDAKKVILSSATVRLKTAELLGISTDELLMFESPSTFPINRRPIIHIESRQIDYRLSEEEIEEWVQLRMDPIIGPRADRKGIIHSVSYKRQEQIARYTGEWRRILTHRPNETRMKIEEFKGMSPYTGAVLISPAVTTGYDFPYMDCEYQIITKVPRPDTRAKVMKARMKVDPDYIPYITMQELVQMSGRGMRAEDDLCETFIIDDNIGWFMKKFGKRFAPRWFRTALQPNMYVWPIPEPPKSLTEEDNVPF